MTPERIAAIREWMHLSVRSMAAVLGIAESSLRQMEKGTRPIPAPVADWYASLGRWQRHHPPPEKSR